MPESEPDRMQHPPPEVVTAYLDGGMPAAERDAVEAHLSECRECRDEVFEVFRVTRSQRRLRMVRFAVPIAAAAAVILVLLRPPSNDAAPDAIRSESPAVARFEVVRPVSGEPLDADSLVLTWRSAGPVSGYRITVADPAGEPVWRGESADTALRLPVALRPGSYFWFVDAVLADGSSVTSGMHRFEVRE